MSFFTLSDDIESKVYLKCLISIAKADGRIDESETNFINLQARVLNIDPTPFWENEDEDIDQIFVNSENMSRVTKLSILRDCIVLSHLDRDYDQKERERVLTIADKMNINERDVHALEGWLKELWHVLGKGEAMIIGGL